MAPADRRGHFWGSDSLLELCNFPIAIHVAIARDFLAANFPVEAQAKLFDIRQRCVALIKALLFRSPEVNKCIRHGDIKLLHDLHFAGLTPF